MIYDHLSNLNQHLSEETAQKIQEFLATPPSQDGRYALDGEKLTAIIETFWPRTFHSAKYESHFKHIDLQIMLEGTESIFYHPIVDLIQETQNLAKDIAFYQKVDKGISFPICSKMFCLLFPQDGHLPSVGEKGSDKLRKVVFKILI